MCASKALELNKRAALFRRAAARYEVFLSQKNGDLKRLREVKADSTDSFKVDSDAQRLLAKIENETSRLEQKKLAALRSKFAGALS